MAAPPNRLTLSQAQDLARYYLGPEFTADEWGNACCVLRASDRHILGSGSGWREAFRNAGVKLPARPQFVAEGNVIMLGGRQIAITPLSNTWARRIARALNNHIPDRRGI